MAQNRHLNNAPIREAIIDIQFEPAVKFADLEKFAHSIRNDFQTLGKVWQHSIGGADGTAQSTDTSDNSAVGLRLRSKGTGHVFVVRTTGITFSQLAPYENWGALRVAAKAAWERFLESVKPSLVNRLAVRYINVLPLPLDNAPFEEYLTAPPAIPAALPQGVSAFIQRLVMVDRKEDRRAIVTQALEEPQAGTASDKVSIFLDIDTFRAKRFEAKDEAVWDSLDNLRDFKNLIFFEHITEKTAELFQ